jgi:hypothetical protein
MKYSFYCKHCGYTFMSDSEEDVQDKKALHKTNYVAKTLRHNTCLLIPTGRNTIARPLLAEHIKNNRLRKVA